MLDSKICEGKIIEAKERRRRNRKLRAIRNILMNITRPRVSLFAQRGSNAREEVAQNRQELRYREGGAADVPISGQEQEFARALLELYTFDRE